jgi:calcium-dependent protein kinase
MPKKHASGKDLYEEVQASSSGSVAGSEPAPKMSPESILAAEASSVLELADEQLSEGMRTEAARNYHTATIYFRVLENLVPSVAAAVHSLLMYASCRTQMFSHLVENFVHEHFEGTKCADVYIINEGDKIGKGSYGSVYKCTHRRTGVSYACKVIPMNRINSHYLRKLHYEIAIMKETDHPNIVKLREVFFGSRTVYLVMDLYTGGELFAELIQKHKRGFEEAKVARMMEDMISSVLYLHRHTIMHRDLKLENFLFETKSENSPLRLIDFGLSKHFAAHEKLHQVVGSAYYTAPEVLRSNYDESCDTWSLGVISYMLLCGSPPFTGESSEAIHNRALDVKPASYPSRRFGHVSAKAIAFTKAALEKDVTKRASLEELLNHPFIKDAPESTTPDMSKLSVASTEVVDSMCVYMKLDMFKKAILGAVAFTLTTQEIEALVPEFRAIDEDRSGTISIRELKIAIQKSCEKSGADYAATLAKFPDIDSEEQGQEIEYNEFIAAAMCRRITIDESHLMTAFEVMDPDGTGYLDFASVRRILGANASESDVVDMIKQVDSNGDGKIDYQELLTFWRLLVFKQKVKGNASFKGAVQKVIGTKKILSIFKGANKAGKTNSDGGDDNSVSNITV